MPRCSHEICPEVVKVKIPNGQQQNVSPFWMTSNTTGELSGFYIDFLKELFKEINKNYTIDNTQHYASYFSLGIK